MIYLLIFDDGSVGSGKQLRDIFMGYQNDMLRRPYTLFGFNIEKQTMTLIERGVK